MDQKYSSLHAYSKEPSTGHFPQSDKFKPRPNIQFLLSFLILFRNLSLILPRRLFPSSFFYQNLNSFPASLSFPYASQASGRFSSCNFTNEYLLCFRITYSLSKRIRCWKWMKTKDDIDKKHSECATTLYALINWNLHVMFISESHITSVFQNS